MYNEDEFLSIGLHVVELSPEIKNDLLIYRVFLKELPQLAGEGFSKKEAYMKLTENYLIYREAFKEEENHEETTTMLTLEQLLHYYDGENFDGFKIHDEN